MSAREPESPLDPDLLRALPLLARLAIGAWWRTTQWTMETSMHATTRLLRAAVSGESTTDILQQAGSDVRDYLRRLLGVVEQGNGRWPRATEEEDVPDESENGAAAGSDGAIGSLRERGAELLRHSADIHYDEAAHPAYERILSEMAPDEGRILRLLALEGPQAAVDVREARLLRAGSELVAPGLSMIGAQAGVRYEDRMHAYLNNLYRLGLIWFSREPLRDPLRYQVLEAQPEVAEALREAGRGKTVRRSIHLTAFGEDFCQVCLPLDTGELEALPGDVRPEPPRDEESDPLPRGPEEPEPPTDGPGRRRGKRVRFMP